MHRHEGNTKPAGTRSAYFFCNAAWLRLCSSYRVCQKCAKNVFPKFYENRHFGFSHFATPLPGDNAEEFNM